MKTCFKCRKEKPLCEFYKHKNMSDGHLNKCKECTKRDSKITREANIEYYREYDRARGNRQSKDYHKRYNENNPEKYKARTIISNSIRDGWLEKPENCSLCGEYSKIIHGHHPDYNLPTFVKWLCPSCHRSMHV